MRPKIEQSPWLFSLASVKVILASILIGFASPATEAEAASCEALAQQCYNFCDREKAGVAKDSCITACKRYLRIAKKTKKFPWERKPEEPCT